METIQNKIWHTPELVILSRNQTEEAILYNCKSDGSGTVPQQTNFVGCLQNKPSGKPCIHCDAVAMGS